jgi:hypothetical protein
MRACRAQSTRFLRYFFRHLRYVVRCFQLIVASGAPRAHGLSCRLFRPACMSTWPSFAVVRDRMRDRLTVCLTCAFSARGAAIRCGFSPHCDGRARPRWFAGPAFGFVRWNRELVFRRHEYSQEHAEERVKPRPLSAVSRPTRQACSDSLTRCLQYCSLPCACTRSRLFRMSTRAVAPSTQVQVHAIPSVLTRSGGLETICSLYGAAQYRSDAQ